ncbi:sulfite exporter TauE/SafE family protein [Thalassomonas actiniarum]|uniref:Probable membrane transporter protein n=1 Tax=Thalassomonas actiniarum TaxID=485447 RepID=A0AAE9YQQ4_9GAMM|nr:sulfite exporter TauE/SafE family protein [Thalassomonas actiniarum]WDD97817.1 sulfite exporter TauE/SafE family protein [Thalassomonas actiniarum]
MNPEFILPLVLLGCVVGFMAGLLGIGGGGIMVPVLTGLFLAQGVMIEQVVHLALGTSMASIIMTSLSSSLAHHKHRNINWFVVKGFSPGVVLGAFIMTFIAAKLSGIYLVTIFSLFMAYVAVQMFLNKKPGPSRTMPSKKGLFFAGSGIGGISSLVSIGGGSLTVPYLLWHNIDIKKAIATSAAIGLPISIAGSLGYLANGYLLPLELAQSAIQHSGLEYRLGFIYAPAVLLISVCSFFTAPLGAKLVHRLPVALLKKIFALLLFFLSVKMFCTLWSAL